jgi:GT2 family glycosyltransferase
MASLRDQLAGTFPADIVRSRMLDVPRRLTDKDSWHGHIPFAFWCVEALAPRVLVELGCHKGDSYCAFCQAVDELGAATRCFGVDTWKGDPHAGFYGEDVLAELRQYHDPRYGAFSTLVRATFDEALERFEDGTIDLLHIDGAHAYEDVRRDFTTWLPKISRPGVVLFHDTEVREHGFGVHRFWDEVRREHPSFSFPHSHGLGVLAVGTSPPEPLRRLTSLDEKEAEEVRRLFARLGDAVRLQTTHHGLARQRVRVLELEEASRQQEASWRGQEASLQHLRRYLETALEQTQAALRFREQQVDAYVSAQESLLRSTSWKLTAPVRYVSECLQRLRGRPKPAVAFPLPPPPAATPEAASPAVVEPTPAPEPAPEAAPEPAPEAEPKPAAVRADSAEGASDAATRQLLDDSSWMLSFPRSDPVISIVVVTFNQVGHTYGCLEALLAHADVPYELVVVDNASSDATARLLDRLQQVTVLRNETNVGFGKGCNQGAQAARGELLLFLNNDARIAPGCLSALVEAARADPRCGAVGGKLVWPDGRLQEAGAIVWQDGTAEGYGRGSDPSAPEFSYRREVDYCSGALLLVRRELFAAIGGFDDRFAPAYYEDADLCMAIRRRGHYVVYEPRARALHHEHGSSSTEEAWAQIVRNHERFADKWKDDLSRQQPRATGAALRARERVHRPRLLVIDDRVPTSDVGSGYPRSHAILRLLRQREYPVTLFPSHDPTPYEPWRSEFQRLGVEMVCDGRRFSDFATERAGMYDVVFVSRPHNFAAVRPDITRCFPRAVVIYDAEALFFVREEAKTSIPEGATGVDVASRQQQELDLLRYAHLIVTVSEREKRLLARAAPELEGQIAVWGHPVEPRPTPRPFADRRDLLFLGSFFAERSPNEDALAFLVREVLPLVVSRVDCRLHVVGYKAQETVSHLASERVEIVGYAEDLTPWYDRSRVLVVPHRYSAGIPLKLCEGMARGLPAVVSELTALQLGVEDGKEVLVGRTPAELADAIVRLLQDEAAWNDVRASALDFVRRRHDPETLGRALDDLIAEALAAGPTVPA